MPNLIKKFSHFNNKQQELIIELYNSGNLKSIQFTLKEKISDGLIYEDLNNTYIIPKSSLPILNLDNINKENEIPDENFLNEE